MSRSNAYPFVGLGFGFLVVVLALVAIQVFTLQWLAARFIGATLGLGEAIWPLGLVFVLGRVLGAGIDRAFAGGRQERLLGLGVKLLVTAGLWVGVASLVLDASPRSAIGVALPMTLLSALLSLGIEVGVARLFR